jgi:hypothetical protein
MIMLNKRLSPMRDRCSWPFICKRTEHRNRVPDHWLSLCPHIPLRISMYRCKGLSGTGGAGDPHRCAVAAVQFVI